MKIKDFVNMLAFSRLAARANPQAKSTTPRNDRTPHQGKRETARRAKRGW